MQTLFENILTASLYGGIIIATILLLRPLMKRVPRKYLCLLWLLAFLRLVMPFEINSSLSLQPRLDTVNQPQSIPVTLPDPVPAVPEDAVLPEDVEIVYSDAFTPPESIPEELEGYYPAPQEEEGPTVINWNVIALWCWAGAAVGLILYSIFSFLRLKNRVREAVRAQDGTWECAGLDTAFILGWVRPRVYLPTGLSSDTRHHILRHEKTHLKRLDHWMKLLGFLALSIHWFNPLVWVAWVLLCRDMELACDEQVVKDMGLQERKDYSAALLRCSTRREHYLVCPVAFGEVSVKTRILSVLNYRKPRFWISLAGILAIVFVAVFLIPGPAEKAPDLSFLNYENAVSLAAQQTKLMAVYYTDSSICPGEVSGPELAKLLDNAQWRQRRFTPRDLSSPGSIEFLIEDNYRITLYDRRFARVRYGEEIRYYRISKADYNQAVELLTTPEEILSTGTDPVLRCREALDAIMNAESYHIQVSQDYTGASIFMPAISEIEYWKVGSNRMSRFYPDSDTCTSWRLRWLDQEYSRLDCATWFEEPHDWMETELSQDDNAMLLPWFHFVNWEEDSITLESHITSGDSEVITLHQRTQDDSLDLLFVMTFHFDKDGTLTDVDRTLAECNGVACTGIVTTTFVSFDSQSVYGNMLRNAQAPDILEIPEDVQVYSPTEEERELLLRCYSALMWHQVQDWRHYQHHVTYSGDIPPDSDLTAEYWHSPITNLRRISMADRNDGWLAEETGTVYCKGIAPYYPEDVTSYTLWVEAVDPEETVMTTWLEEYQWDFSRITFLGTDRAMSGTVISFRVEEELTDNLGGTAPYHDVSFCLDEDDKLRWVTDKYTIQGTDNGEDYSVTVFAETLITTYDRNLVEEGIETALEEQHYPY